MTLRALLAVGPGLVLWLVLAADGGIAAAGAPQQPGKPPDPIDERAATSGEEPEWLLDEATGQQYRIEKVPKAPNLYSWLDDDQTRILYRYGMVYEVVDHDADWFWVKVWRSVRRAPVHTERSPEEVAAERAEIAATYRTELATVDRVRLEPFAEGLPGTGQWRQGFDVADMNGDGQLDIVFGPPRKSMRPTPRIFLRDGASGWRPWAEARFPGLPFDYGAAAVGDLNGDGAADLVLGVHLRGILALLGDGEGSFREWRTGISFDADLGRGTEAFSARAVELADWDGDGRLDIVALGEGPHGLAPGPGGLDRPRTSRGLLVYRNRGDGSWAAYHPAEGTELAALFGDDFALADFDGDGRTDFAAASRVMGAHAVVGLRRADLLEARDVTALRPRAVIDAVEAADLDGDGRSELFVAFRGRDDDELYRTGIDLLSPGPELDWQRRSLIAVEGRHGVYSLDSGDVDGDGRVDLVALTGNGEVQLFLGEGDFFALEGSPELPETAEGCRGYGVKLVDLDGDGADDIVAAFAGEAMGLPGLPGSVPGCPSEGSLRVWLARTSSP